MAERTSGKCQCFYSFGEFVLRVLFFATSVRRLVSLLFPLMMSVFVRGSLISFLNKGKSLANKISCLERKAHYLSPSNRNYGC